MTGFLWTVSLKLATVVTEGYVAVGGSESVRRVDSCSVVLDVASGAPRCWAGALSTDGGIACSFWTAGSGWVSDSTSIGWEAGVWEVSGTGPAD